MATISVNRKQLSEAVSGIAPICKKNSPKEILKYLHFDANGSLTVFATNLEQGASRTVEADIQSPGKFIVDAAVIQKFLNLCLDETIYFAAENNSVLMTSARSRIKTDTPNVADYPAMQFPSGELQFTAGPAIRALLSPISSAAKGPEERLGSFAFDSLCLALIDGNLWMACSDGAKIAYASLQKQVGTNRDILLPLQAVRVLESQWKIGTEAAAVVSDNAIYFSGDGWSAYSLLVDGRYPQWKQKLVDAIDETFTTASVDTQSLARAVDTAIIAASTLDPVGDLLVSKELISVLVGDGPSQSESSLPCSATGEVKMSLNVRYMRTAIASFSGTAEMSIRNTPKGKALVMSSDSHSFIVMGVREDERQGKSK